MARKKQHKTRIYQQIGEPGPGTRVAGYVRYSSDMQQAASITTQKRAIQALADKKGWILVAWFEEPEQSAKYEEERFRPQFAALLRAAGHDFAVVLCYDTSRWSRNVEVGKRSIRTLRAKGVWWQLTEESWTIDNILDPGYGTTFGIALQMAEDYVVQLSKRTSAGKENRALEGFHNGHPMFGYQAPDYEQRPPKAPMTWKPPRMPVAVDPETFPALVKIGELAAQGWSDQAIADALEDYRSVTPRFGERRLSKDTVASIRRSWFPREFAPGCGHGTIDTPSGELVEGQHAAAWPYALWQRMNEAKRGQYRRPAEGAPVERKAHAFSRIIVCAACRRALRVSPSKGTAYYKDTSAVRKLPCPAFGALSVKATTVLRQFGAVLASVALPAHWREAVAARCEEEVGSGDETGRRIQQRREALEAEQKRLVTPFTKGYLAEADLDAQVERLRAELATLPIPLVRDAEECTEAAIAAGETLSDMAGYWSLASPEERRDMVWALLVIGGLIYDLEQQVIVGLQPRPDVLPVLALALEGEWEQRDDGLWLRADLHQKYAARTAVQLLNVGPPYRAYVLTPDQRVEAATLVQNGHSPQQVADQFGVSYWVILRLMKRTAPKQLPTQQQPKLSPAQAAEARRLLQSGLSMRKVAQRFPGVSYGAIWRLLQRDRRATSEHGDEAGEKGGEA